MFFLFLSKSRNSIISKSRENQTFASAAHSYFFPLQLFFFLHKIKLKTFQTFALLRVEEEKTQIEEIKGRTPSTNLGLDRAWARALRPTPKFWLT